MGKVLPLAFHHLLFQVDPIDEFLRPFEIAESPPPKWAMERKPEKRAAWPQESVSPMRSNHEYSRARGILLHVLK
jgi:hypothetical protein